MRDYTPVWYKPWRYGEGHWWYWVSALLLGAGIPLAFCALAVLTSSSVSVFALIGMLVTVIVAFAAVTFAP